MVDINTFLHQVLQKPDTTVSRCVEQTGLAYDINKVDGAAFLNEPVYHRDRLIVFFNHYGGEESILLKIIIV